MSGMSDGTARPRRKPGRRGKGPRYQRTIRFPVRLNEALEKAAGLAGYSNVGDYVVDIVYRAQAAGLFPAQPPGEKQLTIGS